jgi:hypothetical protein
MLTVHLTAAASVLLGGIVLYRFAIAATPKQGGRDGKWLGWLAFLTLGILVSLFFVLAAAIVCFLVVVLLAQLGLRPEPGRELEMLIWPFITLPLYVATFIAGTFRVRAGKRPDNTIERDARRSSARPSS